jgi:hypothetical protein
VSDASTGLPATGRWAASATVSARALSTSSAAAARSLRSGWVGWHRPGELPGLVQGGIAASSRRVHPAGERTAAPRQPGRQLAQVVRRPSRPRLGRSPPVPAGDQEPARAGQCDVAESSLLAEFALASLGLEGVETLTRPGRHRRQCRRVTAERPG